jgi:hypothetical protein
MQFCHTGVAQEVEWKQEVLNSSLNTFKRMECFSFFMFSFIEGWTVEKLISVIER